MKSIIFLDVDGVLTTPRSIARAKEDHPQRRDVFHFEAQVDQNCLTNLVWLIGEAEAGIVISSTWRKFREQSGGLSRAFRKAGIDRNIVLGSTPWNPEKGRLYEIRTWIADNMEEYGVEQMATIAIDDNWIAPPMVLTNHNEGLTKEKAEEALNKLRFQWSFKDRIG